MSTLMGIYNDRIKSPMQKIADEIRLEGLTKLLANTGAGLSFSTHYESKMSQEDWITKYENMTKEWEATNKGPCPSELFLSNTWMPGKLFLENYEVPKIQQAYMPINFVLPIGIDETYGELKNRIEEESMRAVEYIREFNSDRVNAFYLGNLRQDYELPESTKHCIPFIGDSFLDKSARDILIPRIMFNLCLFEIDE